MAFGNVVFAFTLPDFTMWILAEQPGGVCEHFPASLILAGRSKGFVQVLCRASDETVAFGVKNVTALIEFG
ncbi:MAG: hypothetical protein GX544_06360 [Chloroflexi bacterium]|nr:hypothetical protein [Chloroflexota bacterium]